ncbi:hypothetical protein ACFWN1_11755 [Streptomyces sp. NPDC058459]|uniref:hypothetical protein n=1 Tax=Streptomyces sp. NPDC058459 TaxID=3346508 RepID=UPI003660F751
MAAATRTEVREQFGSATVPREVTPGLCSVMQIAGTYAQKHGRLPGEQTRHGLGWWAAQDTHREKKPPTCWSSRSCGGRRPHC